mmetsp:Transcript_16045/g.40672  ORF Transcript_16045/g.40672 Transcript_16045/m.40672 type:complete len:336 (+) Transcript_16045:432-1439(+)
MHRHGEQECLAAHAKVDPLHRRLRVSRGRMDESTPHTEHGAPEYELVEQREARDRRHKGDDSKLEDARGEYERGGERDARGVVSHRDKVGHKREEDERDHRQHDVPDVKVRHAPDADHRLEHRELALERREEAGAGGHIGIWYEHVALGEGVNACEDAARNVALLIIRCREAARARAVEPALDGDPDSQRLHVQREVVELELFAEVARNAEAQHDVIAENKYFCVGRILDDVRAVDRLHLAQVPTRRRPPRGRKDGRLAAHALRHQVLIVRAVADEEVEDGVREEGLVDHVHEAELDELGHLQLEGAQRCLLLGVAGCVVGHLGVAGCVIGHLLG